MADIAAGTRTRRIPFALPSHVNVRFGLERMLVPIALLALWELVARAHVFPPKLFPPPSRVAAVLFDWIFGTLAIDGSYSGRWTSDAAASAFRVFSGYALATVAAIAVGMSIGWSRTVDRLVDPTVQLLRPIPPVSWIPLAIIWFGVADRPAIFLVFIGAFFPIVVNTVAGVRAVDRNLIRAAAMMGAKQWQILRYIVWPAAVPSILTGMRISVGTAWMLTVTAEMIAVKSGLGYALWDSYYFLRYDLVIAAMISIGVLGFASDLGLRRVTGRVLHWQRSTSMQR